MLLSFQMSRNRQYPAMKSDSGYLKLCTFKAFKVQTVLRAKDYLQMSFLPQVDFSLEELRRCSPKTCLGKYAGTWNPVAC